MTDDQVAQIARGLSEAQREALLSMPPQAMFSPRDYVKQARTWARLKAKLFIRPIVSESRGVDATSIITPLGLAVRAYLERNPA